MTALRALVAASCLWALGAGALELTPTEAAGRRIFHEGVSPSGSSISARVGASGTPIPATVVRCANCHGADARGRPEGGVRPPDITWRRLTTPYGQRLDSGREHPPYDEAAFARAVTLGIDPAGNRLDQAMPRFVMSMRDLADLTAYLKRVEDDHDPGLLPDVVRIGMLLPAAGPGAELGATAAAVVRAVFDGINAGGGIHGRRLELEQIDPGHDRREAAAAVNAARASGRVFALVAPLVPALEGELGAVLDDAGIPAVGALGALSEGSGSRIVFDPLPGMKEQFLALGEFAAGSLGLGDPVVAVVHPDDARSRMLAAALVERLGLRGWSRIEPLAYPPGAFDAVAVSARLVARGVQAVFYLGADEDFGALAAQSWQAMSTPYLLAVSSEVGPAALRVPPQFSERVFLAYPLLPQDWTPDGVAALEAVRKRSGLGARHGPLQVQAYAAALVLSEGLKRAGRDASRAKLVSALEQLHDFNTGLTPPIRFGPGQRVGALGAHIVTVDLQKGRFRPTGRYIRLDRTTQ